MTVSVALSPIPVLQFLDNTGRPAVGGSLTTQVGGVNYPAYSDNTGNTALPNPIPLNSRGEISTAAGATSELFLQAGVSYTFILKDSAGNQLWSVSNVVATGSAQSVTLPAVTGTANAIILTNAIPITVVSGTIQWFVPTASNTGAVTINDDNNGAVAVLYNRNALLGNEIGIGVPTQVMFEGLNWNLITSAKGPQADYYLDTGTVNAMVVATGNFVQNISSPSGINDGIRIKIKAAQTNTSGSVTLTFTSNPNINGLINLGSGQTTAPPIGAIISGNIYELVFFGGVWLLMNPSRVTGSFTITLSGFTTTVTGTVNYAIEPSGKVSEIWVTSNIQGTSNTTAMIGTGVPALLTTGTSKRYTIILTDASAVTFGNIVTGTSTTWTFGNNAGGAAFTGSGTKGLPGTTAIGIALD